MNLSNKQPLQLRVAIFYALLMVSLAVVGGVLNYSPIPWWDMWDGVIGFYAAIDDGIYSAWWAPHNEHRIVITRALFWLDRILFSGRFIFLIVANYVLVLLSSFVFWIFIKRLNPQQDSRSKLLLWLIVTSWLFMWCQKDNLAVAFQSQFFLAYLLPMLSFYFLASSTQTGRRCEFWFSCLAGLLSAGTMANGVLALPLAFLLSIMVRASLRQSLSLMFIFFLVAYFYFFYSIGSPGHGGLAQQLIHSPLKVLTFVVLYIGNPLSGIFSPVAELTLPVAYIFGTFALGVFFCLCLAELNNKKPSPYVRALLIFFLFVLASATATAGGRLSFGTEIALTSRYTTPSIMATAALLVISGTKNDLLNSSYGHIKRLGVLLMILMLVRQTWTLWGYEEEHSRRMLGALALSMSVRDSRYLERLYSDPDALLLRAEVAIKRGYSIFNRYPYIGLGDGIGKNNRYVGKMLCKSGLLGISSIDGVSNFVRVSGKIEVQNDKGQVGLIRFLDIDGNVVGYALDGLSRKLDSGFIDGDNRVRLFMGYVSSSMLGKAIDLVSDQASCHTTISLSLEQNP